MTAFTNVSEVGQTAPELMVGSLITSGGAAYYFGFDTTESHLMWLERVGVEYNHTHPIWKEAEEYLISFFTDTGVLGEATDAPLDFVAIAKFSKGQSLRPLDIYQDGRSRNTRVIKMIGLAHATGPVAFYSSDHAKTVAFLESIGSHRNTDEVNESIRQLRVIDNRPSIVIVEGPASFMAEYKKSLSEPDYVVFVGSEEALQKIEVEIVDREFTEPRTLDEILFPKKTRTPRKVGQASPAPKSGRPRSKPKADYTPPRTVTRSSSASYDPMDMMGKVANVYDEQVVGATTLGTVAASDDEIAARAKAFAEGVVDIPEDRFQAPVVEESWDEEEDLRPNVEVIEEDFGDWGAI